jgi:Cu+-exporting ATPase
MALAKDVVCGMTVDPDFTVHKAKHKDKTYYFCSPGCKKAFNEEPEKYISPDPAT